MEKLPFDERVGKSDENACELSQEVRIELEQRVDDKVRWAQYLLITVESGLDGFDNI